MTSVRSPRCPLCLSPDLSPLPASGGRRYHSCAECGLVHLEVSQRLDSAAELAHYRTHENDPEDARYRAFLSRLSKPLAERLTPGATGLDYGSGPGPTLSLMLEEEGFRMRIYDPFFAPDPSPLQQRYDFITCTETVEHFHAPREEFQRLDRLLIPGGCLGVMTLVLHDSETFATWHYARDPTHVCFYRPATFSWIADFFGWFLTAPHPNVVLFHKPEESP